MCVTCGCSGEGQAIVTSPSSEETTHTHTLEDGTIVTHSHSHASEHRGEKPSHSHVHLLENSTEISRSRDRESQQPLPSDPSRTHAQMHGTTIALEREILGKNNLMAAQNRGYFKGRNILALNLVSSPGSGKTTLLARTIRDLQSQFEISVIEGDQATLNDAQKIRETGCKVVQINTGTGCHLEAEMVARGYEELNPPPNSILTIENVGNLVCPALFDLGERAKVAILSVTEGEDKPIKYPHMFRASEVMILTKLDLLPHVPFDVERCIEYARQVNPHIQIFQVSALSGEGLTEWYDWLKAEFQTISR